jgi:hypothetical protein
MKPGTLSGQQHSNGPEINWPVMNHKDNDLGARGAHAMPQTLKTNQLW